MALNFNIPMPQSDSFSKNFDLKNILQQAMERQKLAEAKRQHEADLELKRQQMSHAARNDDLQRQILQENLLKLQHANDPMYRANQYQALEERFRKKGGIKNNITSPTQEFGQGMGVYSPEGLETTQKEMKNNNDEESEIDYELLKKHPALRGLFKEIFHFDPLTGTKPPALTGAARDAESMEQLRQLHGKDSPIVKEAEAIQHYKQQQQEDLSAIRQRQLNGLKPGDTEIKDPETGSIIGFKKQTDAKQKESAKNTVLFNELYPLVYKGGYMLSGPGATAKLEQAASEYNTNPDARKLIDDFLIAEKALGNTTVTEAARFGAGKTNQTYNRFAETLKAEDIHKKLKKWIKEYEIPPEATLKAGLRWTKILNDAEKKANSRIPATYDYYFDPEKQFAAQNASNEHLKEKTATETIPISKEDEALIKYYEPQLIKINPKYTAENIKTTHDETGLSIGQVIDRLMTKGQ